MMHLPWILCFFKIISILNSLCILSSANPTSFPLAKGTANHELHLNRRSHPPDTPPTFPDIHPLSKRSPTTGVSYGIWGNGWTSRSYTFFAIVPVIPAAASLSLLYANTIHLSSSFPPALPAGVPTIFNGLSGNMVRLRYGGFELRFFSATTAIPWSFVRTVAERLRENSVLGFTGLHGTVFLHEAAGLVVWVSLTAVGAPVPVPVPVAWSGGS